MTAQPTCPECHQSLILLPSGWLSCPAGHGKLVPPGLRRLSAQQEKAVAKHDADWRRKLKEAFPPE